MVKTTLLPDSIDLPGIAQARYRAQSVRVRQISADVMVAKTPIAEFGSKRIESCDKFKTILLRGLRNGFTNSRPRQTRAIERASVLLDAIPQFIRAGQNRKAVGA